MSCTYNLRGKIFNSEYALDDFLLSVDKHYEEMGDLVFQLTKPQASRRQAVLSLDSKVRTLYKNGKVKRESTTSDIGDTSYKVDKPYIGVSDFLKYFMDASGDPIFKNFNEDDYWAEKRKDWASMAYWNSPDATDYEKDQVFQGGEPFAITDESTFQNVKSRIKELWKQQSYLGTATHDVMHAYWDLVRQRKGEVLTDLTGMVDYVREKINRNVSDEVAINLNDLLTDQQITQIIQHAINIHNELREKFAIVNPVTKQKEYPTFLSEVGLVTGVEYEGKPTEMVGVSDLLVIDARGDIHVIDYKTSPKPYSQYNKYKQKTFYYQLATYRRMLERNINISGKSGTYVIPIQFQDFKYENGEISFSNVLSGNNAVDESGNIIGSYLEELPIYIGEEAQGIMQNLNRLMPVTKVVDATTEEILDKNKKFVDECFTSYADEQTLTVEKVRAKIERQHKGKITKGKNNKYVYQIGNKNIIANSDVELIEKVKKELEDAATFPQWNTQGLKKILSESQEKGTNKLGDLHSMKRLKKGGEEGSLQEKLSRYTTNEWKVIDVDPALDALGIIILKNMRTDQIDVIKVSSVTYQELSEPVKLGATTRDASKNSMLTGNFESDVQQQQRPKSLILPSNYGNIELMQTMDVLNMLPKLFDNNSAALGEIIVVDLKKDDAMEASNKELLYNYNELCKLRSKHNKQTYEKNNFDKETIKVLDKIELLKRQYNEVMHRENEDKQKWAKLKSCTSLFDNFAGNNIKLRRELLKLIAALEENYSLRPDQFKRYKESESPQHRLYYNALMAIAEIDGIDFRQQVSDHDSWFQRGVFGLAGSMYDNPGNMQSSTLNYVSQQVNIAYQNVRDDITKLNAELRNKLNKLKQEKEYTWLYTRTIGNQTDLYKDMFQDVPGKFLFKNPFDSSSKLSDAEREFLQFAVLTINANRYSNINSVEDLIHEMEKHGEEKYLQVPLTKGTTASRISVDGLLDTCKNKLKAVIPGKQLLETIKQNVEGFISNDADESYDAARNGELWEMTNYFEAGENENVRTGWFSDPDKGVGFFEHNLETLVLKHAFAHSMKENMDNVFPVIKAARVHLSMQGIIANENFEQDIKYLTDFIKAKIFNLSLHEDHMRPVMYVIGEMMAITSKMALAFNPRQLYQMLDGIWKDIALVWRKPDGETSFTKKNMMDSFFWIYKENLSHFGDTKSLGELINEQYGINDMDMNTYNEKISSDNVGLFNFWTVGFRFASRPDFYNRMTLFGAQMRGDGCFDAHYIENGRLKYDWTKDKRFSIFAANYNNPAMQNDPEFKKQKALYIATAKQFEAEHAKNDDGTEFELNLENPQALPKAYTVQQSESMKALSDLTYGYYSHEKKSLVQSTSIGAMFLQMATYWSSKKNQYLAPGGVRMQGRMKQYVENGVPMWHEVDANGVPTDKMTTENTGVPFMQWSGQWQEGILMTLINMAADIWTVDGSVPEKFKNVWDKYYNNEDENLKKAYRNNLKHGFVDLVGFAFLGSLVSPSLLNATKEYIKDVGNDTFQDAFVNNCLLNTAHMFSSSTNDFNAFSSLLGKGLEWTPFSISSMGRTVQNLSRMISGDTDLYDGMLKMFSATRGQEPLFDYIKMATLGRSIGDNGRDD